MEVFFVSFFPIAILDNGKLEGEGFHKCGKPLGQTSPLSKSQLSVVEKTLKRSLVRKSIDLQTPVTRSQFT
jgi:hypothetical protein